MSEGRQVGLVLLGLVLLAAVGFGGAALFPAPCDPLEREADLVVGYASAAEALGLADGGAVEAAGEEAGLGPWRGAVAVPPDASLLPSEAGAFVVTDDAFVVLRPGFGAVSGARARDREAVVPAHRAIGLRADDGTTALYDGELDQLRCGTLPEPSTVLDVDRGVAVARVGGSDGTVVEAVTLSGERLWQQDLGAVVRWAWVVDREVALGSDDGVAVVALDDGTALRRLRPGPTDLVDARGPRVLLTDGPRAEATAGLVVLDVVDGTATALDQRVPGTAVLVPSGVVAAAGAPDGPVQLLGTDVRGPLPLPPGTGVAQLVASDDGVVTLLVVVDDRRVALQWGPAVVADEG